MKQQPQVELAGRVPFISDADLETALDDSGVDEQASEAVLEAYGEARPDGLRSGLAVLALLVAVARCAAQRDDAVGQHEDPLAAGLRSV